MSMLRMHFGPVDMQKVNLKFCKPSLISNCYRQPPGPGSSFDLGKSLAKRMTRKSPSRSEDLTQSCPSLNEIEPKSVASLLRMDATPQTRNGRRAITNWTRARWARLAPNFSDGPSPFRQTRRATGAQARDLNGHGEQ